MSARRRTVERCGWCGQVAKGEASINGIRYCHEDSATSCYQAQQHMEAKLKAEIADAVSATSHKAVVPARCWRPDMHQAHFWAVGSKYCTGLAS